MFINSWERERESERERERESYSSQTPCSDLSTVVPGKGGGIQIWQIITRLCWCIWSFNFIVKNIDINYISNFVTWYDPEIRQCYIRNEQTTESTRLITWYIQVLVIIENRSFTISLISKLLISFWVSQSTQIGVI